MYKHFFILLILLSSCSGEFLPPSQDIESQSDVHVFEAKNGFEIFYDSGASEMVKEYYTSGSIVLNGSYFGVTDFGAYYPAGLWESESMICCGLYLADPHGTGANISTAPNYDDPNLGYIVGVSGTGDIWIFPRTELKRNAGPYKNAFQAGPLVLSGNILQSFPDSWHANGPHERTLIGKTQSGKVYFFVFEKPMTLAQVGDMVIQDDRFTSDPITLLNLDGGPSTAYYDGKNGFRENAKLPIIFRIKE